MDNPRLKDVYVQILARKTPQQIVAWCSTNRYFRSICTDDFWRRLILARWGYLEESITKSPRLEYRIRYEQDLADLINYVDEPDKLQQIINRGIDLNLANNFSVAPLLYAIYVDSLKTVKLFLEAAADPNTIDYRGGDSALSKSINRGSLDISKLLLEYGADPNLANQDGSTPLINAIWHYNTTIIPDLLLAGADVNLKDNQGVTALMMAVGAGQSIVAHLLISEGADLNAADNQGNNALHYLAKRNSWVVEDDTAKLLLAADIDINKTNNLGRTPLHLAILSKKRNLIQSLIDAGADLNIPDNTGVTPLDMIRKYNRD